MKGKTKLRIDAVAESRNVNQRNVEESLEDEMREIMQEVLNDDR